MMLWKNIAGFLLLLSIFFANHTRLTAAEIRRDCDKVLDNKAIAIKAQALSGKTLLHQAEAYQRSGHYKKSIQALCFALQKTSEEKALYATLLGSLGHAYFMLGKIEKAVVHLEQSINQASQLKQPAIAAVALNNLGNVCATYRKEEITKRFPHFQRVCAPSQSENKYNTTYYRQSAELATQAKNNLLAVKASLNFMQMAIDNWQKNDSHKDFHNIKQALFNLLEQTQDLELSPEKIQALLRLGRLIILSNQHFSTAEYNTLRGKAYEVLKGAWHLAQQTNDRAGISQALGYKAQLYQHEKRYPEALNLTRQAVFFAQALPELLYYWQWQMASIFQEQGEHAKSALAYKQAIDTLWSIRYDLSKIYRTFRSSFREQVSALFYEFTELLLTHASDFSLKEKEQICRLHEQPADCLKKLQDTLEKLKAAELLDYFQNECVIKNQISLTEIGLEIETAVLYPIMLKDRLELLLHKAGGMTLISVTETNRQKLEDEIYHLRYKLNHGTYWYENFKKHAQNLYDWLIHPLKESNHLQDIKTLVLVPDGQLRTMPIAALHDGKNYLIEHYALAVIPGLTLRVTSEQESTHQSVLLAGLDLEEPVNIRGYNLSRLDTKYEVDGIKKHIAKTVELLNQDFTETHLKEKLIETGYSMVHISSHAVFEADIKNSFILMSQACPLELEPFEDLLTLNRIHDTPLNLITLSACETALGDERAALGLGGVALRAGAQSAVATLWKVKPDFTTRFMPIFYENISKGLSKAKALQETQKAMIKSDYYQHPYFWSSFTLIGNWLK